MQKDCPVKPGKKHYYLRYEEKTMRLAQRRAYEQTEEFKDQYRWRAGVEATMSEYDRRTGVKHLRVRKFKAVRFAAVLKATGLNIFRAAAVRKAIKGSPGHLFYGFLNGFKHINTLFENVVNFALQKRSNVSIFNKFEVI